MKTIFGYKGFQFYYFNGDPRKDVHVNFYVKNGSDHWCLWDFMTFFENPNWRINSSDFNDPDFRSDVKKTIDEIICLYSNGKKDPNNIFFPLYPDFIKMFLSLGFRYYNYPMCFTRRINFSDENFKCKHRHYDVDYVNNGENITVKKM